MKRKVNSAKRQLEGDVLKMKGTLYFWLKEGICQHVVWDEKSYNWMYQSEERARKYLSEEPYFDRWATKKEFDTYCMDRAKNRLEKALKEGNFKYVFDILRWNHNTYSRKAFYELTGHKLSDTMKVRIEQLKEIYKEEWDKLEEEKAEKERQEEQKAKEKEEEELNLIENDFKEGTSITGIQFVRLCDRYEIKMHLRGRGFCMNTLANVSRSGHYRVYRTRKNPHPKSNEFTRAYYELREKLFGEVI